MIENILILFVVVCLVWHVARNRGYKAGEKFANEYRYTEGYKTGVFDTEEEFKDMCRLPDDELMERINKIRKNESR